MARSARNQRQGLRFYQRLNPRARKAALIYAGDRSYQENDAWILSFRDLPRLAALDHTLEF